MDLKYKVWVEVENVGNRKLVNLFVSHNGGSSTGIRIENPEVEIPLIISALQRHLTPAAPDAEGGCYVCGGIIIAPTNFNFCPMCGRELPHQ